MTGRRLLEQAVRRLAEAGIEEASWDAWLLLSEASGMDRASFLAHREEEADPETVRTLESMLARREAREPLQYILGKQAFYGLDLIVTPDVLIPRQDTEVLVETVLRDMCDRQGAGTASGTPVPGRLRGLDLCTGSGCIAIALSVCGKISMDASDLSEAALAVARRNGAACGADINWLSGDLWEAVPGRRYDLITSNPPYITDPEYETLQPEVRLYEPAMALKGGADGLAFYRRILEKAPEHLLPGGRIYLEIGAAQAADVSALCRAAGLENVRTVRDLTGRDRVICAERRGDHV